MRLAVVILNWKSAGETISCALAVESWKTLRPVVIVVDNGSGDSDRDKISRHCPGALLISNSLNRGYAGGNNDGMRKALELGCDRILLLNNDASVTEGCVRTLLRALEENPALGMVGPLLKESVGNTTIFHSGGKDIARFIHTRQTATPAGKEEGTLSLSPVDYVPGTALLMRSTVFSKIGPLDERYFFSGEVADLCERAKRGGFGCAIDRRASAAHRPAGNSRLRNNLYSYYSLRNRFLFIRLHRRNRFTLLSLWAARGLFMMGGALLTLRWSRARAIALAVIDGLRGKWGNRNELFNA